MAVSFAAPALSDALSPLVKRARAKAAHLAEPVLASLTRHLGPEPGLDPLALLSEPQAFFWDQPARGLALAGVGQAARITGEGPGRFAEVRGQLSRLMEQAVISQDSGAALRPAPLSFAGFAFDPDHPDSTAWFGFPDAVVVVPRLLVARSGAHLFLTANLLVRPEEPPGDSLETIARSAGRILSLRVVERDPSASELLDAGPEALSYWCDSVRGLTGCIARGEAEKVVLARRAQVESGGIDLQDALARLRLRFPECTIFAVRAEDACFLGATPETLVSLRARHVTADCLAGSAARGDGEAEDRRLAEALLSDDKERREHDYVTRSVVEALAPMCSETRVAAQPGLRKFANVQHLHTPIEALTGGRRHVLELVEALHPSAATAGLPRAESLSLIRRHEAFSRGWYAGPLGWIDSEGGGEFAVALRSALVRDNVASLYAGCGIVAGSDPLREYTESELKLQVMLWALRASNPRQGGAATGEAVNGRQR